MTAGRSQKSLGIVFQGSFCIWRQFMTDIKISYTTLEQQIEKLKRQGMIIDDVEFAKSELQLYGYSNLIKSYRDPYVFTIDGKKLYRSGVTFEQIWSLYILDKNLRNAVMASMLDLEERIKEAAADVISNSFGIDQNSYLAFRNYSNKKKHKYRFSLPAILDTMKKALETDKDPISHYSQKYGTVPPWILFKSIYFSTIVNFINLFKPPQQQAIASKLYSLENLKTELVDIVPLMMDTLFICLEYRNLAAHGGRIYNYTAQSRLRFTDSINTDIHGFSQLLLLLHIFDYQTPYEHLSRALNDQLNRHCSLYPEDITYLGQILNINITTHDTVWVAPHSNKYHIDNHCSGIKNPMEIELSEAEDRGLTPCRRCCK